MWADVGEVYSPSVLRVSRLSMPFHTRLSSQQLLVLRRLRMLRCIGSWNRQWNGEPPDSPHCCSFQLLVDNNPALEYLRLHFIPPRPTHRTQGLIDALPAARQLMTLALHGSGSDSGGMDWSPLAGCTGLQTLEVGMVADGTILPAPARLTLTSLRLLNLHAEQSELVDWLQAGNPLVNTLKILTLLVQRLAGPGA